MNPFLKIGIGAALVGAVVVGALALRSSIYAEGFHAGQNELKASIEARNKEVERLNKQLVTKDQDVIAAKEEDREKIVTIYRTIREQVEPQIVEKPVFRDCRVGAGVMRSLVAAAEGRVPTDPNEPAEAPGGKAAGAGR